jgi:hypothetical protein
MLCAAIRLLRLGREGGARPPMAVSSVDNSWSGGYLLFVIRSVERLRHLSAEVV